MQDYLNENRKKLLSIGALAKSFDVNASTIRRIEDAGLLMPALIVSGSGYRYYDRDNVAVLSEILALKSCGFTQDDIREYLLCPGDYSKLLEKLLDRQQAINRLVERFGRRLPLAVLPRCELVSYEDSYCVCKQAKMVLTPEAISEFSKDFLFETIQNKIPINYSKAMLICTDSLDYKAFHIEQKQEYTFCIPIKRKVEHQHLRYIPASTAICFLWNDSEWDYTALIPLLDAFCEQNKLEQIGNMSIAYEVGGYFGNHIPLNRMFGYLLIPVTNK